MGDIDVHASTEPSAEVGGAGEDVAQVLTPHELLPVLLDQVLNLQYVNYSITREHPLCRPCIVRA